MAQPRLCVVLWEEVGLDFLLSRDCLVGSLGQGGRGSSGHQTAGQGLAQVFMSLAVWLHVHTSVSSCYPSSFQGRHSIAQLKIRKLMYPLSKCKTGVFPLPHEHLPGARTPFRDAAVSQWAWMGHLCS